MFRLAYGYEKSQLLNSVSSAGGAASTRRLLSVLVDAGAANHDGGDGAATGGRHLMSTPGSNLLAENEEGEDTSRHAYFRIVIEPVNDPPEFVPITVRVLGGTGNTSGIFARNISAGAGIEGITGNEKHQEVHVAKWDWSWDIKRGIACFPIDTPEIYEDITDWNGVSRDFALQRCLDYCYQEGLCTYAIFKEFKDPAKPYACSWSDSCDDLVGYSFRSFLFQ